MDRYSFLKKHGADNHRKGVYFISVTQEEIDSSEKKIGIRFPEQLRCFYETIGYGVLAGNKNDGNQILPPHAAAEFYKPHTENSRMSGEPLSSKEEDYWMSASTYEDLQPGDLPVFEISDSNRFLIMRPRSDSPNAVWSHTGVKIEDSFEKFIWRLYYESPTFYDDIIEAHYKALKENT